MDKQFHLLHSVWWNYLSIPKRLAMHDCDALYLIHWDPSSLILKFSFQRRFRKRILHWRSDVSLQARSYIFNLLHFNCLRSQTLFIDFFHYERLAKCNMSVTIKLIFKFAFGRPQWKSSLDFWTTSVSEQTPIILCFCVLQTWYPEGAFYQDDLITHSGLVTPYCDMELGQHLIR